jgi:hypothetical protein
VQVHCDEGVANHIGPEPCAVIREDGGEASAGEHIGQPLSRERDLVSGADAVQIAEGKMTRCVMASICRPGVVEEPGMYGSFLRGNREISCLTTEPY